MSKRFCKKCKSTKVVEDGYYGGTTYYNCKTCHHLSGKDEFPEMTLFDRITESEEMLAEKFVFKAFNPDGGWSFKSILLVDKSGNYRNFYSKQDAIDETVAKLKEVCDER